MLAGSHVGRLAASRACIPPTGRRHTGRSHKVTAAHLRRAPALRPRASGLSLPPSHGLGGRLRPAASPIRLGPCPPAAHPRGKLPGPFTQSPQPTSGGPPPGPGSFPSRVPPSHLRPIPAHGPGGPHSLRSGVHRGHLPLAPVVVHRPRAWPRPTPFASLRGPPGPSSPRARSSPALPRMAPVDAARFARASTGACFLSRMQCRRTHTCRVRDAHYPG